MIQKVRRVGAIAASVILYASHSFACDCVWGGPFQKVSGEADLLVTVRVEAYGPTLTHGQDLYEYMKVSILDVLTGEEKASTLLVYGDPGNLCRPYVTPNRFGLGRKYVMALHHLKENVGPNYGLSNCGEYWLGIENGKVIGRISRDKEQVMSYEAFRGLFASSGR